MASSNRQARAPISSHPAFPAIVALWFAALLGIGSLIVPAELFEQLFKAAGLAAIFAAAKAPLGLGAKLAIAGFGAVIGGLAGLMLGRKVAAGGTLATVPAPKQPISALEELGANSLDQPVDAAFGELAEHTIAGPIDGPIDGPDAADWAADFDGRGVFCDELTAEDYVPEKHLASESDAGVINPPVIDELPRWVAADAAPEPAPEPAPAPAPAPAPFSIAGMSAEQLLGRPLNELGIVQLVERFALSLQQRPAGMRDGSGDASGEPITESLVAESPVSSTRFAAELPDALRPVDIGQVEWGDDDGEDAEDEEFSSLLNLGRSAAAPRKSVELPEDGACDVHETVAIFREEPADTDRTLRDALAQLEKMSRVG